MQGDGDHETGHGSGSGSDKADEYTDLTQVSSTKTIQSDQTIVPATIHRQNSLNSSNVQPQRHRHTDMTRSRASSTSIQARHARSTSSSTAGGSTTSQRQRQRREKTHSRPSGGSSSMHGQQPTSPTSGSIRGSSSSNMSPQKREQLIALHRESCRLFQEPFTTTAAVAVAGGTANPIDTLARSNSRSTTGNSSSILISPAASPILQSQRSYSYSISAGLASDHDHDHDVSDEDLLAAVSDRDQPHHPFQQPAPASASKVDTEIVTAISPFRPRIDTNIPITVPATITEWTSPSTRRREYEKIDRNNRGLRGLWRRWTPSCMHAADTRVPFFEETTKRKECAGSVRRFRMDLPDEDGEERFRNDDDDDFHEKGMQIRTTTATTAAKGMVAGPKVEKRGWSCF